MRVVGVDLGGTTTTIGLVDEKAGVLKKVQIDTEVELGFERVVERIAKEINSIREDAELIGIGAPGSIVDGVVKFAPNFPDWIDAPLASKMRELTGLETFVENDANAFVLGEKWFGAGRGYDHIVALTLGTGVGGGVITHGILLRGYMGIGAELGHVVVEPNGPICGCGNYGCLEAIASGTAIVRQAREGRKKFPDSLIFKHEEITPKVVFDSAREGDTLALRIRDRVVRALALAIASFAHIFNPQVVIIGGGISRAGDILFEPLREEVRMHLMPSFVGTFEILESPLVEDAALLGAASVALETRR